METADTIQTETSTPRAAKAAAEMQSGGLHPGVFAKGIKSYSVPKAMVPTKFQLDANEGRVPQLPIAEILATAKLEQYPSRDSLTRAIAAAYDVAPEQVLVTAGGDEAIERACKSVLGPGSELVLPEPTFEMIGRYVRYAGAEVCPVAWNSAQFPLPQVIAAISAKTRAVAVVSPNNPTGYTISAGQLRELSAAAPQALLIVDLAYAEFADEDLTPVALSLPNAVVIRTFSKAWGLAGLRVGYAIASAEVITWMNAVGGPYPTASLSLATAEYSLRECAAQVRAYCDQVREERQVLQTMLSELGIQTTQSQGNFVLLDLSCREAAEFVWRALASFGISVRLFGADSLLSTRLRITCPGEKTVFTLLQSALRAILAPQAILFDMDGVLADVSQSYRRAIILTARSFGIELSGSEISRAKTAGDANNDWVLTQRLLNAQGVDAPLEQVTSRFEEFYQGTAETPGLRTTERLLFSRTALLQLSQRYKLAIVTGRPRKDALSFLTAHDLQPLFQAVVCMEDAALKPDPEPVLMALKLLNVAEAWMIGDTPDDLVAARAAEVVPIGVLTAADCSAETCSGLLQAGAASVLNNPLELTGLIEMFRSPTV